MCRVAFWSAVAFVATLTACGPKPQVMEVVVDNGQLVMAEIRTGSPDHYRVIGGLIAIYEGDQVNVAVVSEPGFQILNPQVCIASVGERGECETWRVPDETRNGVSIFRISVQTIEPRTCTTRYRLFVRLAHRES